MNEGGPKIADALLAYFDAHRRPMPWRETADPYGIWVSEVMLQQTRVETAAPYWERWMRRFPTVAALADAELDDVLVHWQGLGYYSRARNLHRAARLIRERFDGAIPSRPEDLRTLPGVGEYTAGAVASIAYGAPVPAVDGNVRRVLSRLHDLENPGPAVLRERAAALVPADRAGDFNQALMELGATICTPRAPACDRCPVRAWCRARDLGVQADRPRRRRGRAVPQEAVETAVLVAPGDRVLLVRRPEAGLLGGLWEFPGTGASSGASVDVPTWVGGLRSAALPVAELDPVRHVFSHLVVVYAPTLYRTDAAVAVETGTVRWAPLTELGGYALPTAQRRIAASARTAWFGAPLSGP